MIPPVVSSELLLDLACGTIVGGALVAVTTMLGFAQPPAVRAVTVINRFAIGFVVGALDPPAASWLCGVLGGVILALSQAIDTRRWASLVGFGAIGAVVLGLLAGG